MPPTIAFFQYQTKANLYQLVLSKNVNDMTHDQEKYPLEFYYLIFTSITVFLADETTKPILPLYISDVGANLVELGIIIGVLSITLMAIKIPLGAVAEIVDGRIIIIGSSLAQSISQFSYALVPELIWFYPIRILQAFSIAPIVPMAIGRIQEFAPEGKTSETLGTFLTSYGVAITFGPFLCSSLLLFLNYIQLFIFASLIPIIGVLPFLFRINLDRLGKTPPGSHKSSSQSLSRIFHSRNLVILTNLRLLFAVTYGFFATYFVVYAEDSLAIAPFIIALLLGIRGLSDMLLRIPVGRIIDRSSYKVIIFLAFALLAGVYFFLSVVTNLALLFVLMILLGLSLGLRVVSEWTMAAHHSPEGGRSITAAYLSTMFNVGSGFGAILGGYLALLVEIPTLFRISAVVIGIGVLLSLLIQRNDPAIDRTIGGWKDNNH